MQVFYCLLVRHTRCSRAVGLVAWWLPRRATCISAAPSSCTKGCKQCNTGPACPPHPPHTRTLLPMCLSIHPSVRPSVCLRPSFVMLDNTQPCRLPPQTERALWVVFFFHFSSLPLFNRFVCKATQNSVGHIFLGTEQRWHKGRAPTSFDIHYQSKAWTHLFFPGFYYFVTELRPSTLQRHVD